MISKSILKNLYLQKGKSQQDIAKLLGYSLHKVSYWVSKHHIKTRSISEAVYLKNNPDGDPFNYIQPRTAEDKELFGLGLGLYWGEGTKANKTSVRLGNTDPSLIKAFMMFLIRIFKVEKADFRFNLQIFSDIDINKAVSFWAKELGVSRSQFTKTTMTVSGSIGTYRHKSSNGVLTLNYHNKKLRDLLNQILNEQIEKFKIKAVVAQW